jgi:D-ribose pyranase
MKKSGILNQPISAVIAALGHTDMVVVADAGLPIPPETQRIDLALKQNVPGFIETLEVVLTEMHVEGAIIAEEMRSHSPRTYQSLAERLGGVPIQTMTHEEFKKQLPDVRAVIRTGEFTSYANVILISGVRGFQGR